MTNGQTAIIESRWRDYLEMCKPRVVLLMLLTMVVGMFLAVAPQHSPPFSLFLFTSVGVALVAASAAVINHVADSHVDKRMARTSGRPMANGRVPPLHAALFSAVMGVAGMSILAFLVNPLTAWLNLASWAGYGLLYTLYLKHATPQNIVIGGLFGAAPPLFGWTAVTGSIALEPLLLVLIIFMWTPPHFWALALERKDEYANADVPMLPVTHGERHTRIQVLVYTILLSMLSVVPFIINMSGMLYLTAAVLLAGVYLYRVIALVKAEEGAPMKAFRYSIVYLGALFTVLLVDHHWSVDALKSLAAIDL